MRGRTILVPTLVSLLLSACSGVPAESPAPPASPVSVPPAPVVPLPSPAPAPSTGGESTAWLTETPVDRVDGRLWDPAPLPRHDQACQPIAGANAPQLEVHLLDAAWTLHPLPQRERFWTPVATLAICNVGTPMTDGERLELQYSGRPALEGTGGIFLPPLKAGEGLGPVRLFTTHGWPEPIGQLWSREGSRWPELTLTVLPPARSIPATLPVKRELTAGASRSGPGKEAETPDLAAGTLPILAWSHITFGDPPVTVSLYAPDSHYSVQGSDFCGGLSGDINAEAEDWVFYISKGDGAPVKALALGQHRFESRRGIAKAEMRPEIGTTFLPLAQYGSCANSTWYELYAFDHQTGELYRPQMENEDGTLRGATASQYSLGPDGALSSRYYNNASPETGYHNVDYRWDGAARTWRWVSHTRD